MDGKPDMKELKQHTLSTDDGSALSYYSIGTGPGLLILHGAATYALTQLELAELLAGHYTVYLLSRRGRGLSDPYPKRVTDHTAVLPTSEINGKGHRRTYNPLFTAAILSTELSDIDLVIQATQAPYIIALSSGACLTLQACISSQALLPAFHSFVKKIVIFEPPLNFEDLELDIDFKSLRGYEDAMTRGDVSGALIEAMRAVQLGPLWIPKVVMKALTALMLWSQNRGKNKKGEEDKGNCTMGDMAPLLRYDFALAELMVGPAKTFEGVAGDGERELLLLSGEKSPGYNRLAMRELEKVVKGARIVTLEGVGHEVLCNAEMRGNPVRAVGVLKEFFG
jgi:pimeloyl-ACP methyl ester carboxylesterase